MSLNLDKSTWKRVRLGDVIRRSRSQADPATGDVERYVGGGHIDSDSLTIERFGDVNDGQMGSTFTYLFKPGQILFVSARPYLRKSGVVNFSGVVADKTYVLDAIPENGLLQEFLAFVLASDHFIAYATAEATGSMNPRLLWGQMQRYEFHVPPLDEQQRLADLLWALERYRLSIQERADRARDAAAVVLRHAWEAEHKVTVGDIGECVTGSTPSKANADYWSSEVVPFYTPSEIDGEIIAFARQRVSLAGAKAGRMLPKNAVAVACIGGDLGKSAVVVEPGISNQQITSVIGLPADDAELLQAVLAHPLGRAALKARETTTIVRKLNKSDLMKVKVPWPEDRTTLHAVIRARRTATVSANVEASRLANLQSELTAEIFGGAQ
ncbi:restriction endonuclease subunit S [Streptomyces europaeiscabiei]|uniref:Restriction endonuclease subunit S n=1 Tax=Streptomyces europaeiscabiei TaxID=146819 RepID=A0AAJ2PP79_9ACTN|nr:restriction endonuclease subunit S [Streptomyces europaeiscabiei]MDX3130945.1 restriction endonuclease subunit S [Streptomyces europaeiscabiei]